MMYLKWPCGHPRTGANTAGVVKPRCKLCHGHLPDPGGDWRAALAANAELLAEVEAYRRRQEAARP